MREVIWYIDTGESIGVVAPRTPSQKIIIASADTEYYSRGRKLTSKECEERRQSKRGTQKVFFSVPNVCVSSDLHLWLSFKKLPHAMLKRNRHREREILMRSRSKAPRIIILRRNFYFGYRIRLCTHSRTAMFCLAGKLFHYYQSQLVIIGSWLRQFFSVFFQTERRSDSAIVSIRWT